MSSTIRGPPRRTEATLLCLALMDFAERLVELRKERSLTQAALSKRVGIRISQIKRYEGGKVSVAPEIRSEMTVHARLAAGVARACRPTGKRPLFRH